MVRKKKRINPGSCCLSGIGSTDHVCPWGADLLAASWKHCTGWHAQARQRVRCKGSSFQQTLGKAVLPSATTGGEGWDDAIRVLHLLHFTAQVSSRTCWGKTEGSWKESQTLPSSSHSCSCLPTYRYSCFSLFSHGFLSPWITQLIQPSIHD